MTHAMPSQQRIALVTGAAKGIGAAIAERLAHDGMQVLIGDIDEAQARVKADELTQAGLSAAPLLLDVGDAASVAAAFEAIDRRWHRCDVVVNNAGIAKTFPFVEFPLESWQAHLNINVTGALLCAQYGARLMLQVVGDGSDVAIGGRVRLVLRKYAHERGVPVYGFKAQPVRAEEKDS